MAKMTPVASNAGAATPKLSDSASPPAAGTLPKRLSIAQTPPPLPTEAPSGPATPAESKDEFTAALKCLNLPPELAAIAAEGAKLALLRAQLVETLFKAVDQEKLAPESAEQLIVQANTYQTHAELSAFASLWTKTIVHKADGSLAANAIKLDALVGAIATAVQMRTIGNVASVQALLQTLESAARAVETVNPETAARLDQVLEEQNKTEKWGNYVYDPEEVRNEFAQSVIDAMMRNPGLARAFPMVQKMARRMEEEQMALHTASAIKLDRDHPQYFDTAPYALPVYELCQDWAREYGLGEVDVYIKSDDTLNAYVFTSDQSKVVVVIHDSLIQSNWDFDRNDFAARDFLPDANKFAKTGTGVKVGEKALGAAIGHELGHVKDHATEYGMMLSLLLQNVGINIFDPAASSREIPATLLPTVEAFGRQVAEGALQAEPTDKDMKHIAAMFAEMTATIERTQPLDPEGAVRTLRDIALSFPESSNLVQSGPMATAEAHGLLALVSQFTQAQENTADHWPQVAEGTSAWTSLLFETFSLTRQFDGAMAARKLDAALAMDPQQVAEDFIDRTSKFSPDIVQSSDGAQGSHRYGAVRIQDGAGYCAIPNGLVAQVKQLKSLPQDFKAFAMLQLFQRRLDPLEYSVENEPDLWNRPHAMEGWVERHGVKAQIADLNRVHDALACAVIDEMKKEGWASEITPTLSRLIAFLSSGQRGAAIGQGLLPARFLEMISHELETAAAATTQPKEKYQIQVRKKIVDTLLQSYKLTREKSKLEYQARAKEAAALRKALRNEPNGLQF